MEAADLQNKLIEWTVTNSGHDPMRRYLGMSRIGECPRVLYREVIDGPIRPDTALALRFHAGYLWEHNIKQRLLSIGMYAPNSEAEIVAEFDPRFRGHIDGKLITGDLLEIKSTVEDNLIRIADSGRIPRRHFAQVQVYMDHGNFTHASVVYVARDTGQLYVAEIWRAADVARWLNEKAKRILAYVDRQELPECECGRCT